jgi:hypothetical protein
VTRSNGERRHKAGKGGLGQNNPRERGEWRGKRDCLDFFHLGLYPQFNLWTKIFKQSSSESPARSELWPLCMFGMSQRKAVLCVRRPQGDQVRWLIGRSPRGTAFCHHLHLHHSEQLWLQGPLSASPPPHNFLVEN